MLGCEATLQQQQRQAGGSSPALCLRSTLSDWHTQAGCVCGDFETSAGVLFLFFSLSCRGIQPDHFGVLALPVAEFLAVKHDTSYLGYSQHSSSSSRHPFFASGPPSTGRRPAGPDAADADADAAAAAAMDTDGAASGGDSGGKKAGGLKRAGSASQRHRHRDGRRPSSEAGLRLITCTPASTLGEVRVPWVILSADSGAGTASTPWFSLPCLLSTPGCVQQTKRSCCSAAVAVRASCPHSPHKPLSYLARLTAHCGVLCCAGAVANG